MSLKIELNLKSFDVLDYKSSGYTGKAVKYGGMWSNRRGNGVKSDYNACSRIKTCIGP